MFTRILVGLLIAVGGFFLVYKSEWMYRQVGGWTWAERHFGSEGGTRLFLKAVGVLCVFIGLLTVVGLHVRFVRWVLSPLFKFPLT